MTLCFYAELDERPRVLGIFADCDQAPREGEAVYVESQLKNLSGYYRVTAVCWHFFDRNTEPRGEDFVDIFTEPAEDPRSKFLDSEAADDGTISAYETFGQFLKKADP